MSLTISRTYLDGGATATGVGTTSASVASLYAKGGIIYQPTVRDQLEASASLAYTAIGVDGYTEAPGAGNPFPATFAATQSTVAVLKGTAQWTHQLTDDFEVTLMGTLGRTLGADGIAANVAGVGTSTGAGVDYTFAEYGVRLGWQVTGRLTLEALAMGTTVFGGATHLQAGVGFRAAL